MKHFAQLAGATALATLLAVPAFAQSEIATGANATGITQVNEAMRDIEDDVRDDFARSDDAYRFGNPERREGVYGSVALSYIGRDGNSKNQDLNLSGRLSHNVGQFSQSVGILLEYGENNAGDKDTEKTYVIYEGMYNFNDRFYAFGLGRLATDALADDPVSLSSGESFSDLDGRLKRDAFLGFGPGYRVLNNDTTAWRVQAAVGVRYTKAVEAVQSPVDPLDGTISYNSDTDVGYLVSSRFYHKFNDMFFLTNDTDYLTSDASDVATNELGLNFKMSEAFATRVSYKTEYQSERAIRTDNTVGISLVYGF